MKKPKTEDSEMKLKTAAFLETVRAWSTTASPDERRAIFVILLNQIPDALGWDQNNQNYKAAKSGS